jgi:hypothetical protein
MRLIPMLAAIAGFCIPGTALAQEAGSVPPAGVPAEVAVFAGAMHPGLTLESFLKRLPKDFAQLGAGGGTITSADILIHERMQMAMYRFMRSGEMLGMDLDGDGATSEAELRAWAAYNARAMSALQLGQPDPRLDKQLTEFERLDGNKDGRVTFDEAVAGAVPARSEVLSGMGMQTLGENVRKALELDTDGNGELTFQEYENAARTVFNQVDADGDRAISPKESVAFRGDPRTPGKASVARPAKAAVDDAACRMPQPSRQAEIILFGANEAEGLSTATIGSQDDIVETAGLFVEPGSTPLYIVLTSRSAIIWRVTGAVERIEHLVLGSNTAGRHEDRTKMVPLVGATGLPPERVSFLASTHCFRSFSEVPSIDASNVVAMIRDKVGQPDVLAASYSVRNFAVPSAAIHDRRTQTLKWPRPVLTHRQRLRMEGETETLTLQRLQHDPMRLVSIHHPAGIIPIDPRDVVAPLPVEAYSVLPQQAGIRQLIKDGTLTVNRSGDHVIQRKMRFPAGLQGGHSVKFLLLRGVPLPDGDPGHSTVVSEETGLILADPGSVTWKDSTAGSTGDAN